MEKEREIRNLETTNDAERWYLLSTIANLYYNSEMTQNEIADRFYTSRSKISRMLKEARELGIVEITIQEPRDRSRILERKFLEQFSLKHIRIVPARERSLSLVLQKLGEEAAAHLDSVVDGDTVLGISWGNTVLHTVRSIKVNKDVHLTAVPIMGAASVSEPERDSLDLARELANAYGGQYYYIYAPLFVKTKELRDSLIQEPNVRKALDMAKSANVILTSVGSIVYKTWRNYLQPRAMQVLEKKGAVGHIGGNFFDQQGREVKTELSDRMIGVSLSDIRKTEEVICVAGMEEKAGAILAALRGGCIDTLIVDEFAAAKVLELGG